jgi:hypothetical protein
MVTLRLKLYGGILNVIHPDGEIPEKHRFLYRDFTAPLQIFEKPRPLFFAIPLKGPLQ